MKVSIFYQQAIVRDELTCCFNFHLDIKQSLSDTLFLNNVSLCNDGVLHSTNNFYYNCGKKANGSLAIKDDHGIIRTQGYFKDGWPKGKLKTVNLPSKTIDPALFNA